MDKKRKRSATAEDFVTRFKDPLIRNALHDMWIPAFSMFFMFFASR